jgi:drug/metabolite transporter (DMT)-like permease
MVQLIQSFPLLILLSVASSGNAFSAKSSTRSPWLSVEKQLQQFKSINHASTGTHHFRTPLYNKLTTLHESKNTYAKETTSNVKADSSTEFTGDMPFFSKEEKQSTALSQMPNVLDDLESNDTPPSPGTGEGLLWRGVVVVLCALWASNFAAAKLVMNEPGVDSSLYAVSRFSVAALALIPGSIAAIRRGVIDWDTAKGAAICGSWVSFGYLGQTLGLLTTTASRSCVICTLHCVFVAAIAELMRVKKSTEMGGNKVFDFMKLLPAAVAVLGVAIVELKGAGGSPTIGDFLSFAQPIGFGMGYLQLEELVRKKPEAGLPISAIKLIMVTFFSFGMFELFPLLQHEELTLRIPDFMPIISSPLALGGILYTGLITTALALWVESIAFKRVPATDASIILTTEPLFAALAGALTLGETFGSSDYFGATLIIGACALAVLLEDEEVDEKAIPLSSE